MTGDPVVVTGAPLPKDWTAIVTGRNPIEISEVLK